MRNALRCCALAAVFGVAAAGTARAGLALEVYPGATSPFGGVDVSAGFSFTTNQAVTVTALDAYDASGDGANNVRLYGTNGVTLAQATVTNSDPTEGSPTPFHTVAIAPLALAANTTYYVAEDFTNGITTVNYLDGVTTDPSITFNGEVSTTGQGNNPRGDIFSGTGNDGFFGPNFDIAPAVNPVPEPATLVTAALAGLMGVGYAAFRRGRAA